VISFTIQQEDAVGGKHAATPGDVPAGKANQTHENQLAPGDDDNAKDPLTVYLANEKAARAKLQSRLDAIDWTPYQEVVSRRYRRFDKIEVGCTTRAVLDADCFVSIVTPIPTCI
jgi:hypothetical protein